MIFCLVMKCRISNDPLRRAASGPESFCNCYKQLQGANFRLRPVSGYMPSVTTTMRRVSIVRSLSGSVKNVLFDFIPPALG